MTLAELLVDAFTRIQQGVHDVLDGLSPEDLAHRPTPRANSIGWLVWHLTRVQDDHVAEVAGQPQAWTAAGWADRYALPLDPGATGYGASSDDVAAVQVSDPELLVGYHADVHRRTADFLATVTGEDLDRVVDTRWDPPVTLGVRLVSVIGDDLQHAGQAALLRGVLERR